MNDSAIIRKTETGFRGPASCRYVASRDYSGQGQNDLIDPAHIPGLYFGPPAYAAIGPVNCAVCGKTASADEEPMEQVEIHAGAFVMKCRTCVLNKEVPTILPEPIAPIPASVIRLADNGTQVEQTKEIKYENYEIS